VLLFSSSTGAINDINDGRLRGNNVPHLALGESIATADPLGLFTWRPRPNHSPTIPGPTYSPTIPGLAIMSSASLEQALLFGAWRTQSQLLEMSDGDMRNTLIVEMERISSLSISELQALSSCGNLGSLVGFSSISVFLLTRNIRTSAQLSSMDYDDQRNTLITNFVNNLGMTTTDLQALGDFDLTSVGFASNLYAGNAGSGSTTIPGPTYSPTPTCHLAKVSAVVEPSALVEPGGIATKEEAKGHADLLAQWDVCMLQDGQIDGPGHGGQVEDFQQSGYGCYLTISCPG